ncbi:cyclase family protein [Alkaliphilus peptidifermentans]|uniref:Kynurenine formamidase n=1 Tax=Alkaliphilus peptidifermentans DSM 18978 TaxID=1120976 RepID=A0A1G5DJM5_9FIRM|nr:cyclase family protein [Alkaliphilus peptidifermentans]SCY14846.1 Kynurenine formamidase [Alkaliphilus peptidifermentans DSM 18978]
MKTVDLTHNLEINMPVFPGTEPPIFKLVNTFEKDGFSENQITFYSHTGTHIDAPSHMICNGPSLDDFDINKFVGKAFLMDVSMLGSAIIQLDDIKQYRELIKTSDFFILYTGWSNYWGTQKYFDNFPVLSNEAANWLKDFNLKGIGVDTISIDHMNSVDFPIHNIFLSKNMIIIENLNNLNMIKEMEFMIYCLPLKYKDADGSPIRAIGIV